MSRLVAFFSASGVTKKVAERLAEAAGAELYEIKPETPYTNDDLNWRNEQSRSSVEMKDLNCRPAIADTDAKVADADVVYVGFPVWWYREPSIVDTFLDAYDFSGKTIVPFATSGSTGIGKTAERMQEIVGSGAKVLEGKRFASSVSVVELKEWVNDLNV